MRRAAVAVLAALAALGGPARGQDTVIYQDRAGKEATAKGTIEDEGPAGIKIKVGEEVVEVPALAIRRVNYKFKSPKLSTLDYNRPFGRQLRALQPGTRALQRTELLESALKEFKEVDAELLDVPNAHRYIQYKIAEVLAQQARFDPAKGDAAIAALSAYSKDFPTGWEVAPALKLLAKLQEAKGDSAGALETYRGLAKVPGIPPELRQESTVLVARALLRAGKPADAESELKGLQAKMSTTDPQRPNVEVALAQCRLAQGQLGQVEAPLRAALQNTTDAAVRAAAHNLLGDYYQAKGQPGPAFWEYLYVETLYTQDREEHAKALYNLSMLFDKVKNDRTRAKECADRLKDKQFAGTLYQRRLAAEGK
jgi:hypothetical protein